MAASRPRPLPPTERNHVWAYDFVFDTCANGQQLKCLTIIDEWTRECLAIEVAGSIRSTGVIEQLARLVSVHGAPRYLRSDNGPEFVSTAVMRWLLDAKIDAAHIVLTFNNGDPVLYNPIASSLFSGAKQLVRRRHLRNPSTLKTHLSLARLPIEVVSRMVSQLSDRDMRLVGGKPHDLAISPDGRMWSSTGDA